MWRRGEEPEFSRLGVFTDAVFAIALTLLVLDIRIGTLAHADDAGEMLRALGDLKPRLIAFAVAFILLGRYWIAAHDFMGHLRAIDRRLVSMNLVYLAFVAFLPFPASLVGEYEKNPVSVILFAIVLAAISGLETVMFAYAHKAGLLRTPIPDDAFRWGVLSHLNPVLVFLVTIPLTFWNTTVTLVSWVVLTALFGYVMNRRAPESVADADLPF